MPKFMVLVHNPQVPPQLSPEEMRQIFQRFHAWTANLRQQGRILAGEKLVYSEGRVLRAEGTAVVVTDGPYLESKEVLGGFWLIEAASYDEAVQLVSDGSFLPFLRDFGGTLELRQIDPT